MGNMNICNTCGASLINRDGRWVCPACGTYAPEEITNEELTLLYNANMLLRTLDFDGAENAFTDLIERYPKNSAGYWGRLRARFGIKYERDYNERNLPTCYAEVNSVLNDRDYLKAIQYADSTTKEVYRKQAAEIEKIREIWLERASKEKPYDIFICFKDSDVENGEEHTVDSVRVKELYFHLRGLGYRVFFSPVSLNGISGEEYEPYIYNALNTATCMLVYGSRAEYFSSTWMKNEWTRFLKRIREKQKSEGSLLVICDGVNPSELPQGLRSLQAMDAKALSFAQTLEQRVAEIISRNQKPKSVLERIQIKTEVGKKKTVVGNTISTVKAGGALGKKENAKIVQTIKTRELGEFAIPSLPLEEQRKIDIVETFMKQGLYEDASMYVDEILSDNEGNGKAYLLKFLIGAKVNSIEKIKDTYSFPSDFRLLHHVIEFNEKSIGERFVNAICEYLQSAYRNGNYKAVAPILNEISAYASPKITALLGTMKNTDAIAADVELALKFYRIYLGRQKYDTDAYIAAMQDFISGCLESGKLTMAKSLNDEVLSLDEANLKAVLLHMILTCGKWKQNDSIHDCDFAKDFSPIGFDNFVFIEKKITILSEADAETYLCLMAQKAKRLISDATPLSVMSRWFDLLVKYEYSGRADFISYCEKELYNLQKWENRINLFERVEQCTDPENIDLHIEMRYHFAEVAQHQNNLSVAMRYFKKVLEIDESSVDARWSILCCQIGCTDNKEISGKVDGISSIDEITGILKYCSAKAKQKALLDKVLNAIFARSQKQVSAQIIEKCAHLFDELIKYYPENREDDVERLMRFAANCKINRSFELAIHYYGLALNLDDHLHDAYWGILQSKLKCRNDKELIEQRIPITDLAEFNSALVATGDDKAAAERYISLKKRQMDLPAEQIIQRQKQIKANIDGVKNFFKRNKKKIRTTLISLTSIAILVGIVLGIYELTRKDYILEYEVNNTGYTVSGRGPKYSYDAVNRLAFQSSDRSITRIDSLSAGKSEHNTISKVKIPDSVCLITDSFNKWDALKTVVLPDNLQYMCGSFYSNYRWYDSAYDEHLKTECNRNIQYTTYGNGLYLGSKKNPYLVLMKISSSSARNLVIHSSTKFIAERAFDDCSLLGYNEYDNAYYIGTPDNKYFALIKAKDKSITSCTVASTTKVIYYSAFEKCSNLKTINLPSGLEYVAGFEDCKSLTNITLPESLIAIADSTFKNCESITSAVIPDSVIYLGEMAFSGCTSLNSVKLSERLSTIEGGTFSGCDNLKMVNPLNLTKVKISSVAAWCSWITDDENWSPVYYYSSGLSSSRIIIAFRKENKG